MDACSLFFWLFVFPLQAAVLPSREHSILTEDPHNKTDSWSDRRPRKMQTAGEQEVKLGEELTLTNPEGWREQMDWNQEGLTTETDFEMIGLEERPELEDEEKRKLVGGLNYGQLGRKRFKNGKIIKEHDEEERGQNGEGGHLEGIVVEDEEKEKLEQRADGGEEILIVAEIYKATGGTGVDKIEGHYLVVPDKDLAAPRNASSHPVKIKMDTPSGNQTTNEHFAFSSVSALNVPVYVTHSPATQYGPNLFTHVTKTQDPEISPPTRYSQKMAPETTIHSLTDSQLDEENRLVSQVMEVKVRPTVSISINRQQVRDIIVSIEETGYTVKQLKSTAKPKQAKYELKQFKPTANQLQPTAKPRDTTKSTKVEAIELKETPTPKMKPNLTEEAKPVPTRNTARQTLHTPPTVRVQMTPTANPTMLNSTTKLKQTTKKLNTRAKKPRKKSKRKSKSVKKNNKSIKLKEKKGPKAAYFPYFKDNYCPAECACYGRIVQCSDKALETVPYGIPYNSRYILLMGNLINSIQLGVFSEFLSMEFLVLSNNRLTDGSVEGAFEGIPALRRLYLDRNLLENVPMDLPASLEELRLDNNWLSGMSAAAWARCPRLHILSLSNNSLGNDTLPTGVFLPLGSLRTLSLDHNQLALVPLGLPLSIRELYLRGNLIQKFPSEAFLGTSELVILDLSANRLTNQGLLTESLLNTTHLESLNLEGNQLDQVPRHLPPSLKTLNLEGNLISSVGKSSFLHLPHLEHLGLARNKIARVATGALSGLLVLHQLDLSHNALRQVPRKLPRGLRSVALTHNGILSVPRDAFCWGGSNPGLSDLLRVQLEQNLIDLAHLDTKAFRCLRGYQVVHLN